MGRLEGKRAVVTGSAQGIGRAITELFVREGAAVTALDRNADLLLTIEGCRSQVIDLLDAEAIARLPGMLGEAADILVNCAGYVAAGDILNTDDASLDFSMDINVRATVRMIQAFLPGMIAAGGGSIVNIASVAGALIGVPNRLAYCASKGAVAGITRSVGVDYVHQGIRCNAICPGTVQSPSLDERLAATGDAAAAREAFIARQPMGRIGTAEEVAFLALYLASDESAYTTGTMHAIDGGWTMT